MIMLSIIKGEQILMQIKIQGKISIRNNYNLNRELYMLKENKDGLYDCLKIKGEVIDHDRAILL